MPRFAANLSTLFTEVPFLERFALARDAGFDAVEFQFPYDHPPDAIAARLTEHGLACVLFNLPPGDLTHGERGLASLPGREDAFRASVAQALAYARLLGTPRLHCMAGLMPRGGNRAQHRAVFIDNLRYAARALAAEGRTLLIEPINTRDVPGYFLNRQDDAHAICADVGEPNLQVQMDFYHAQIVEGDVSTTLRKHFAGIGHVQIAGVPDRAEPNDGELNTAYLMRLLDELGYAGFVGAEYFPRGRTIDGLGWLAAWRGSPTPE